MTQAQNYACQAQNSYGVWVALDVIGIGVSAGESTHDVMVINCSFERIMCNVSDFHSNQHESLFILLPAIQLTHFISLTLPTNPYVSSRLR